jgi:hypothetical protein
MLVFQLSIFCLRYVASNSSVQSILPLTESKHSGGWGERPRAKQEDRKRTKASRKGSEEKREKREERKKR